MGIIESSATNLTMEYKYFNLFDKLDFSTTKVLDDCYQMEDVNLIIMILIKYNNNNNKYNYK